MDVESSSNSSGDSGFGNFFGGNGQNGSGSQSQAGATVANVVSGSPADKAGLAQGDVITGLGGQAIDSPDALTTAMTHHHPGDSVQIQWTDQSGQQHSATVQLASGPPQ